MMNLGWNVYDIDLASEQHVNAVMVRKPAIVRWIVSIDRHGRTGATPWDAVYGAAFAALAEAETKLVVQLGMKSPDWTAGDWPGDQGCVRWKAAPRSGWFADTADWLGFVEGLDDALPARLSGGRTIWGCWNEPDWRNAWLWQSRTTPVTEWQTGKLLWWTCPPSHFMGWTGGYARLRNMRAVADRCWSSDGVAVDSGAWPGLVRADSTIGVIDVHSYQGPSERQHVDWVRRHIDEMADGRPFFVGEYGEDALGSPGDVTLAGRVSDRLAADYGDRFLGLATHFKPQLWRQP